MRPLKLTMRAFGPYRDVETIDFAELGGSRLFLIHGETGAGKTSLLDAMVFALYGDTSGGERSGAQMRCEAADPDVATEVTFDFRLGEKSYRVRRRPKQDLAAKRGAGLVTKATEAHVWDRTGVDDDSEGRPIALKAREADETVRGLLGFSSEQFRQVVMLPQGRFRELLSSDSREREAILRELFRSERFAAVEDELRERSRAIVSERMKLRTQRETLLGVAGAADEAELASLFAEVAVRSAETAARATVAQGAGEQAARELKTAQDARAAAEELASARRAADVLEDRREEVEHAAEAAVRARKAQLAQASIDQRDRTAGEAAECTMALAGAETALEAALLAEQEATAALAVEQGRAGKRDALSAQCRTLQEVVGLTTALAEAVASGEAARLDVAAAEGRVAEAAEALTEVREVLERSLERASAATDASGKLELARKRAQDARSAVERIDALDAIADEEVIAAAAVEAAGHEVAALAGAFEATVTRADDTRSAWRAGRAAALAASLAEGEPCPVCGSIEHPVPAATAGIVDDETVDAAERDEAAARKANEAAAAGLAAAQAHHERVKARREALLEGAGDDTKPERARDELAVRESELGEAEAAASDVDEARESVALAREAVESCEQAGAAAQQEEKALSGTLVAAGTRVEELQARVPEELRDPAVAGARLSDVRAALGVLEQAAAQASDALAAARESRVAAERDVKACSMNVARASKAEKSAAEALARALERQGFAGDEDLLAALIGEDELAALEVEVAAHRDAVHEAKGRLQQALAWAAAHPETAELAAVEQAAAAAAAAAREALTAANLARADSDNLDRTRDALDDLAAESADADDRYAVVGRLADVATGQAQGAKVSFQRWVLGAYLDDVLRAASQRLESMSKGRYLLERQKEAADMKKASGLDLAVYDGWHNRQRPAVTLSGGESFHAALALALGLAETVQSESGGTRLETIFIDEGFGALDRDALDAAVDALMDLQDSGRLVGVISHVPELRGVIDARLEVTGGPDGSHTRFVVQ